MKKIRLLYWITTMAVSAMMLYSGFTYFFDPKMKDEFMRLGFRDYFRIELGCAKILGAILLVVPAIHTRIREFAYAGFAIAFISAFIAHIAVGDKAITAIRALILLIILVISYTCFHRIDRSRQIVYL